MERVTEKLGDFGRYQCFLYAMSLVVGFISGGQMMNFMWIAYVPQTRCRIPGVDGSTSSEFSLNNSRFLLGEYSSKLNGHCHYCPSPFKMNDSGFEMPAANCSDELWRECDSGLLYDRSFIHTSLGMEYDMACDGVYKLNFGKSAGMVGMLVGAAVFGTLADRFGRRIMMLVSLSGHALLFFGSLILFRVNYPMVLIVQMLIVCFHYGSYMISYTVFMELAGGVYRTALGVMFQGAFTIGSLYLALVVYFFRDWIMILSITGATFLLIIPYFWLYPESIRYAITTGNREVAVKTLKRAAKMNHVTVDAEQLIDDQANESKTIGPREKASIIDLLFRDVHLARATLITFFTWMAVSMLYYGLALNTPDLPGDPLVSFSLMAVADFPGLFLCIPCMEYLGRRKTLVLFMGFAGACVTITVLPIPEWLVLWIAGVGKLFTAGAFAVVYNYSAEMFPTVARTNGIGWGSACARIGSIAAPLIRNLGYYVADWMPFAIYGAVGMSAALLDFFLPETQGRALPDTIEDGKRFVRNYSPSKVLMKNEVKQGLAEGEDD